MKAISPIIDKDLLIAWGGVCKKFRKNQIIFNEGESPRFYYQILEGAVKMQNINVDGKEFVQGIFFDGDSFGEPPLFTGDLYPASGICVADSLIYILQRDTFLKILDEYPSIHRKFSKQLATRIIQKSITLREIVNSTPESRLLAFLDSMKKRFGENNEPLLIPFTRQQIADITGLRVETVIRTLVKMQEKGEVSIINHKLYF